MVLGGVFGGRRIHDYGADHAGAQVALLAWRDEVFAHGESEWRDEGASLV